MRSQLRSLLWFGRQHQLLTVDFRGDKVQEVHSIMNPDKLQYLRWQLADQHPGDLPTARDMGSA
jgi:hypothetical protein